MRRFGLLAVLLASCLLAAAYGAMLRERIDMSADGAFGDDADATHSLKSIFDILNNVAKEEEEDLPSIAAIRFKVHPSDAPDFEKAWRDMAKQVESDKKVDVFELKTTVNDNLFYLAYGEWADHMALHDHLKSDAFQDFAKYVDDHDIRWELHELINMSEDMDERRADDDQNDQQQEEENTVTSMLGKKRSCRCSRRRSHKGGRGGGDQGGQGGQEEDWDKYIPKEHRKYIPKKYLPKKHHRHSSSRKSSCKCGRRSVELSVSSLSTLADPADNEQVRSLYSELHKRKDLAHMMMVYVVPPGQGENFEEAWADTAEQTLKEKGNRIYSLRKVATDNTHYYAYGTWDSYADLSDHLNSKHFDRLHDWAGTKDITWFMSPMEHIGHSKEGGGGDGGSDDSESH